MTNLGLGFNVVDKLYFFFLSYDVAVIQWLTSCDKNRMTTRYITFWHVHVT